jgi:hypothetical protein
MHIPPPGLLLSLLSIFVGSSFPLECVVSEAISFQLFDDLKLGLKAGFF